MQVKVVTRVNRTHFFRKSSRLREAAKLPPCRELLEKSVSPGRSALTALTYCDYAGGVVKVKIVVKGKGGGTAGALLPLGLLF